MGWFGFGASAPARNVNPFSVYKVLRELVSLMAAGRAEVRQLRIEHDQLKSQLKREVGELKMGIDALQKNVLSLIDLAEKAHAAGTASAALNPDQAGIDELNTKVVDALNVLAPQVAVLAAAAGTAQPAPPPAAADPNAPVAQ